jgi:hypothetical protein
MNQAHQRQADGQQAVELMERLRDERRLASLGRSVDPAKGGDGQERQPTLVSDQVDDQPEWVQARAWETYGSCNGRG